MKKYYFILSFLALNSILIAQATTGAEVVRKKFSFARPSLSEAYLYGNLPEEQAISKGFKKLNGLYSQRADFNDINMPILQSSIDSKNPDYEKQIALLLQPYFNSIVGMWWSRDAQGNFSDSFLKARGEYTATDAQIQMQEISEKSRLGDLGYDLIEKSYFVVYDVLGLRTMEEIYDEKDAKKKKEVDDYNTKAREYNRKLKSGEKERALKEFKPVLRVRQGWQVNYKYVLYKLNWDKEIQNDFFDRFWVDSKTSTDKQSKINLFNSYNFPFSHFKTNESTVKVTKLKGSDAPVSQEVMNNLLLDISKKLQMYTMNSIEETVDDFVLRASVHSSYPITAKIGKKESLKKESRYFLYDMVQKDDGNFALKRVGWAYVTKVAKNTEKKEDVSSTSKLNQHAGKRIYDGMLLEEHDDIGLAATIGQVMGNSYYSGFNLGLEFNLSKFGLWTGLYANANATLGFGSNLKMGNITTASLFLDSISGGVISTNELTNDTSKYSKSVLGVDINLGKEIYFLNRGNFYLMPMIGFGLHFFSLNEENDIYVNGYLIENKNQNISSESIMGIELIKADNFRLKKSVLNIKIE